MRRVAAFAVGLALAGTSLPADAFVTPFGRRVNDSIDAAVGWIRNQQSGGGDFAGPATGLAALCMLEQPESADFEARALGYEDMPAEDQARMRRAMHYMVGNVPGDSRQNYAAGNYPMALTVYRTTDGPNDANGRNVDDGMASMVQTLKRNQANNGCNRRGWAYAAPNDRGDLSVVQFAMAGLSAAATIFDDADNTLQEALQFVDATKHGSGGHGYPGCGSSPRHTMTATGIWAMRLGGRDADHGQVQTGLQWMQANYGYEPGSVIGSYYYYMWAAAKALETSPRPRAAEGGTYSEDIGNRRDPVADGFPDEVASWYYDFAYILTSQQADNGSWGGNLVNSAFACLVLERSLGGVCKPIDQPRDERCDQLDNDCDGRIDEDLRNACGLCGDSPVEVCNGLDDDCDGLVDDDAPCGAGEICTHGECAGPARTANASARPSVATTSA